MTVKRRLSKRAVVKENGLGWMCSSTEKIDTKENLARVMAKSKSEIQTVTNGHLGQRCQEPVSNLTTE